MEGGEELTSTLAEFQRVYASATGPARALFFESILRELEVPPDEVETLLRQTLDASRAGPQDGVSWTSRVGRLRQALESPRLRAFRKFLSMSGGLRFLLELRSDVLAAQRGGLELGPLDDEIAHLFTSWFQQGFLFLREITRDSPYRQIRFLMDHDMVHPMSSLDEMGSRLGADRRCFALYHRVMPEEPVVFIEVALTRRLPRSIHEILEERSPDIVREPDTAIFYSINSTQNGLSGLGLGKLLIGQVVEAIRADHASVRTFATLSPVPGFFRRYLEPVLSGRDDGFRLRRDAAVAQFSSRARRDVWERARERSHGRDDFASTLVEILSDPSWLDDPVFRSRLARPLREIAFQYLTEEKDARGKPLNPVAGFHMGNGATLRLTNVHFAGNRTRRGLEDSCGLMVSYVYSSTWYHQLRRSARAMLPWEHRARPESGGWIVDTEGALSDRARGPGARRESAR